MYWLRFYNDFDFAPGLEALQKMGAFNTSKGIDILKDPNYQIISFDANPLYPSTMLTLHLLRDFAFLKRFSGYTRPMGFRDSIFNVTINSAAVLKHPWLKFTGNVCLACGHDKDWETWLACRLDRVVLNMQSEHRWHQPASNHLLRFHAEILMKCDSWKLIFVWQNLFKNKVYISQKCWCYKQVVF